MQPQRRLPDGGITTRGDMQTPGGNIHLPIELRLPGLVRWGRIREEISPWRESVLEKKVAKSRIELQSRAAAKQRPSVSPGRVLCWTIVLLLGGRRENFYVRRGCNPPET